MSDVVVAADIEVGKHHKFSIGGISFHGDTIAATCVAAAIIVIFALMLRRSVTSGVPGRLQLFWETVVDWVDGEVTNAMGKQSPFVVPLAVSLFFFILISNWLALLPVHEYMPPATADVNLTYALGLFVVIWVNINGIRKKGAKEYFSHFVQPYKALLPLNVIEELVKPFTLALRLFGNIFSGGIMVALIGLMPVYIAPFPNALWKIFDLGIGVIQAFIFALLTILYFGMASAGHGGGHDDHAGHGHDDAEDPRTTTEHQAGQLAHA